MKNFLEVTMSMNQPNQMKTTDTQKSQRIWKIMERSNLMKETYQKKGRRTEKVREVGIETGTVERETEIIESEIGIGIETETEIGTGTGKRTVVEIRAEKGIAIETELEIEIVCETETGTGIETETETETEEKAKKDLEIGTEIGKETDQEIIMVGVDQEVVRLCTKIEDPMEDIAMGDLEWTEKDLLLVGIGGARVHPPLFVTMMVHPLMSIMVLGVIYMDIQMICVLDHLAHIMAEVK